MADDAGQGSYIVEFLVVGKSVKVTAIDPRSSREATIIGSPLLPKKMLGRQAVRKLEYMLRKGGDAS